MTSPELNDESSAREWHLGLFLTQQWLQDQGQLLITELRGIKQAARN